MKTRHHGESKVRLLSVLSVAIVIVPAVTLIWLGLRLVEQDRSLRAQRLAEKGAAALDAAVRLLGRRLGELNSSMGPARMMDGAVHFQIESGRLTADSGSRLAWWPEHVSLPEADPALFAEAERQEFSTTGTSGPAAEFQQIYAKLALSDARPVRAGALLRMARVVRRAGSIDTALRYYRELVSLPDVALEGMPADLLARRATCGLLAAAERNQELARESSLLERDLISGQWIVDRVQWELITQEIQQWTGRTVVPARDAALYASAAVWVWNAEGTHSAELNGSAGNQVLFTDFGPVTITWKRAGAALNATAIGSALLDRWLSESSALIGARLRASTDAGRAVSGTTPAEHSQIFRRTTSDTGLPWMLVLSSPASPDDREWIERRRLLFTGLGAILVLLAGGAYMLWWVVQRELAVARLQTEFVAAVSHEFRTPLTSLRSIAELLNESGETDPERRRFYEALERNTDRLRQLVESLLDFARIERGKRHWNLCRLSPSAVAEEVVMRFREDASRRGFSVRLQDRCDARVEICADREAIGHALWNLLDNAAKYSGTAREISVSIEQRNDAVAFAVQDHGIGVPPAEKKTIFGKFVRGETAISLAIPGTGLGLAMVSQIAEAHGGRVELDSNGTGSIFRLLLPLVS